MKAIIPAKCSSSRVSNKNWRDFHEGKSLVEVKISQLADAGINAKDIHVFCEDESKRSLVEKLGATFVLRDEETTKDELHWSDLVTKLVSSIEADDDEPIAWIQTPTPLFDAAANRQAIEKWNEIQSQNMAYDCLITVKPFKEFLLDEKGKPINFSFGRWHEWSQDLPNWYILEGPIHIMKKKTYMRCNYHIGEKPYLHEVPTPSIDIDYMDEFLSAQAIYAAKQGGVC